jgi:hypothetical protein
MKWNWGTKIVISMVVFMLFLSVFFVMMSRQTFYLVEKDYYPKGQEYQQKIDKIDNAKQLGEPIQVKNKNEYLVFTFPKVFIPEQIEGNIVLYRPSDGTQDISMTIHLDSLNQHVFPLQEVLKGKYIAKIDYTDKAKAYYQEIPVFFKMSQN